MPHLDLDTARSLPPLVHIHHNAAVELIVAKVVFTLRFTPRPLVSFHARVPRPGPAHFDTRGHHGLWRRTTRVILPAQPKAPLVTTLFT
jgi:hypothetical protein